MDGDAFNSEYKGKEKCTGFFLGGEGGLKEGG